MPDPHPANFFGAVLRVATAPAPSVETRSGHPFQFNGTRSSDVFRQMISAAVLLGTVTVTAPALANNVGENPGWQFETSADKVNQAYLEDLRQKKASGYYAAPIYNTFIDHQYNCAVTSTATGNQDTNSTLANTPTASGNSSSATGNANTSTTESGFGTGAINGSSTQSNTGEVESGASGNIRSSASDNTTWQALNSDQMKLAAAADPDGWTNRAATVAQLREIQHCRFALRRSVCQRPRPSARRQS